jgi:hypothetical protein
LTALDRLAKALKCQPAALIERTGSRKRMHRFRLKYQITGRVPRWLQVGRVYEGEFLEEGKAVHRVSLSAPDGSGSSFVVPVTCLEKVA